MHKKKRELTEEEKARRKKIAEANKRIEKAMIPALFCYMVLYSFMDAHTSISQLFNFENVLSSLMTQLFDYIIGFSVVELIPIKNKWLRYSVIIMFALLMDCSLQLEFVNYCSTTECIMYVVACFVCVASYIYLKNYVLIKERLIKIMGDTKQRIGVNIALNIISFVLFIAAITYIVLIFTKNHDMLAFTISW